MRLINTSDFRSEVENSEGIVIVDFFATWCRPCKMLTPVFEEVSNDFGDKVTFLKVDIDQSLEIANKFRISSVPTIMIFKNGKPVDTIVGFVPKQKLSAKIKSHL